MKKIVVIVLVLISFAGNAQFKRERQFEEESTQQRSTTNTNQLPTAQDAKQFGDVKKKRERPPVHLYEIINYERDTTHVDTTLSITKDYLFNYLRRDDFGLQPINNVGQTYTSLVKVEERNHVLPLFGSRARHFNFMEAEDINYYRVPTPLTELYFKTTFEQGQQLDAFVTVNSSPRLNLSIAYKGSRSLGKYRHALTSTGNFRGTANYHTKNKRYQMRAHFVGQDLLNEENGGISFVPTTVDGNSGIEEYLGLGALAEDSDRYARRSSITVNFENAESILRGKRFFLEHDYDIIKKTDSSSTRLAIGHKMDLTDKSFEFTQTSIAPNDLFGEAYVSGTINDKVALEDFTNEFNIQFQNKWLGDLKVKASYSDFNYGYNSILTQGEIGNQNTIINRIKGNTIAAGATYNNNIGGFEVQGDAMSILSGDFEGNYFTAQAGYEFNKKYGGSVGISSSSVAPNYNFLLHQSDYVAYNWQNSFDNTNTQKLHVKLKAKKLLAIEASYTNIDNYTYFAKNVDSLTVPEQYNETVNLLKVKLSNQINWRFLGMDNTVMYQEVAEGAEVYRVPQIVTRNSLYYQDHWFRKALYLQTGVTFKYYSAYDADGYDPVLSEFYVQSDAERQFFKDNNMTFGGFPQFDLFLNAKIRQTRIFFKVENFGEAFQQNQEFSAPGYAPRDAVLRFGLVWNFFM